MVPAEVGPTRLAGGELGPSAGEAGPASAPRRPASGRGKGRPQGPPLGEKPVGGRRTRGPLGGGGRLADAGEQFEEGALGHAVAGGLVHVVEELVEDLLGVAEGAFQVGVVAAPHDVLVAHGGVGQDRRRSCWKEA